MFIEVQFGRGFDAFGVAVGHAPSMWAAGRLEGCAVSCVAEVDGGYGALFARGGVGVESCSWASEYS